MKYKETIETKDLILKKAKIEDAESIFKNYWSSEVSAKYMLWTPQKNLDEAIDRVKRTIEFQKTHMAYFVYEKKSGEVIGQAGMEEIEDGVYEDIGIGMGEKFVCKGYGKQILNALIDYIFNELDGIKIICSCFEENTPSRRLQLSCGMKYAYSKDCVRERDNMPYKADYHILEIGDYKNKAKNL